VILQKIKPVVTSQEQNIADKIQGFIYQNKRLENKIKEKKKKKI
jgi:hypothetical protein